MKYNNLKLRHFHFDLNHSSFKSHSSLTASFPSSSSFSVFLGGKPTMFNLNVFPFDVLLNLASYDHIILYFLVESPSTTFLDSCLALKALHQVISIANLNLTSSTTSFNFIPKFFFKLSTITLKTQSALTFLLKNFFPHLCF